jgi:hypothetical protein
MCVRCGNRNKVDDSFPRVIQGFGEAHRLVKELNSEEVLDNTSTSKDPSKAALVNDGLKGNVIAKDRAKGLLRTFREDVLPKYLDKEVEESRLISECRNAGIPNAYAEKIIAESVENGLAYRPRKDWIRFLS